MSKASDNAHYLVAGALLTVLFYFIIAYYPAWIIMLSIVDNIYDVSSGNISNEDYASACLTGSILFIVFAGVLSGLISCIEYTWWVVVPLFLICLYPFYRYICWIYEEVPFYGIDWVPFF